MALIEILEPDSEFSQIYIRQTYITRWIHSLFWKINKIEQTNKYSNQLEDYKEVYGELNKMQDKYDKILNKYSTAELNSGIDSLQNFPEFSIV